MFPSLLNYPTTRDKRCPPALWPICSKHSMAVSLQEQSWLCAQRSEEVTRKAGRNGQACFIPPAFTQCWVHLKCSQTLAEEMDEWIRASPPHFNRRILSTLGSSRARRELVLRAGDPLGLRNFTVSTEHPCLQRSDISVPNSHTTVVNTTTKGWIQATKTVRVGG